MFHKSSLPIGGGKKKSNQEQVGVNYRAQCYLENLGDLIICYVRCYTGQKSSTEIQHVNLPFLFCFYIIHELECNTQFEHMDPPWIGSTLPWWTCEGKKKGMKPVQNLKKEQLFRHQTTSPLL